MTKFACGGFTIGTALTHAVCDGYGVAQIIHALTELAAGKSEPSVIPVWQRERLVGKFDDEPAKVPGGDIASLLATSPYFPPTDMVCCSPVNSNNFVINIILLLLILYIYFVIRQKEIQFDVF